MGSATKTTAMCAPPGPIYDLARNDFHLFYEERISIMDLLPKFTAKRGGITYFKHVDPTGWEPFDDSLSPGCDFTCRALRGGPCECGAREYYSRVHHWNGLLAPYTGLPCSCVPCQRSREVDSDHGRSPIEESA